MNNGVGVAPVFDMFDSEEKKDLKIKNSFSCFTKDNLTTEYTELIRKSISEQMSKDASSTDLYIAEIAVEIDFATYNIYNQNTTVN
mgnify:CR=1 FL=1